MRPIKITSVAFGARPVDKIAEVLLPEAKRHPDIILLPETCSGGEPEMSDGPLHALCAQTARAENCHIVCGMYRMAEGRRLNSMVVFAPEGGICGIYDKVYPYWSEFDSDPPCTPGREAVVVETRFGKLGLPICFDANYPHLWARMAELGADLFLWGSAYSAGAQLQAHALSFHIPIVTASYIPDCQVYDITGERVLHNIQYGRALWNDEVLVTHVTLDLDRRIFHENFNMEKRARLMAEHPEVKLMREMPLEQWFVLGSYDEGVCVKDLARAYGLEELLAYQQRSRLEIDRMRKRAYNEPGVIE